MIFAGGTMKRLATIVLAASCGIGMAHVTSAAEIYKWVDSRGVTHYSDTAPRDAKASRMPDGMGKLSVIPTARPGGATTASGGSAAIAPTRGPERIVQIHSADEQSKLAQWREQCVNERWVDCDDRRALFARYGTMADGFGSRASVSRPVQIR